MNFLDNQWVNNLKDGYLSVGDPDHVPAGIYAKKALIHLNVWDNVQEKLARGKDVRAALALVERGEAPLGIVYSTDAKQSKKVKIVGDFPTDSYPAIRYPTAIIKGHNGKAVVNFFDYLQSPAAKAVFKQYGFAVNVE